jgi:hypothetical protein
MELPKLEISKIKKKANLQENKRSQTEKTMIFQSKN